MTNLIPQILRSQTFHGLSTTERSKNNLKWWLESGNFTFSTSTTKSFELCALNNDEILKTICHDISRFSSSAIESIANIADEPTFPKSNGWMSIRVYYSAFFAAHSLLRMYGRSCSYFNTDSMKLVNATLLSQHPESKKISDGNYILKLRRSGSNIYLNAKDIDSSHAGLWKSFYDLLEELQNSISTLTSFTSEEKNDCVDFLIKLSSRIKKDNNKGWLSKIRNDINYNHSMNSWTINYEKKSTDNNNIKIYAAKWKKPCSLELFSDGLEEKIEFIETSSIIISMMKDLIISIYEIDKSNFLRYTTIPSLRHFIQI